MILPSLLYPDMAAHDRKVVENGAELAADLNLQRVLSSMAQKDQYILRVCREMLLCKEGVSAETILFRQEILRDFLPNAPVCQGMYEALKAGIERYEVYLNNSLPSFSTFITASAVIKDRIELFKILLECVQAVRDIMDRNEKLFASPGTRACFQLFQDFYSGEFLADSRKLLEEVASACDSMYVRVGAAIGLGLKGDRYVLESITDSKGKRNGQAKSGEVALSSVGIQAQAGKLRDAVLSKISHTIKQVNEATLASLKSLRYDIAFYLGAVNLHRKLQAIGVPVCFPSPAAEGSELFEFDGLVDVGLAIENSRCPVGNGFRFDTCRLLVVTGANQGGKSTFIRSVGCAQLMMQSGLFVAANAFSAGLRCNVFTHFCQPEAQALDQGRLNEELGRMDAIVERIDRKSLVLMNESFSTTSEREAAALAGEVLMAFYDLGIKAIYVTHFYEFARIMEELKLDGVHFLAAQRNPDGSRPYALAQASPKRTSYALDIYREVFGEE